MCMVKLRSLSQFTNVIRDKRRTIELCTDNAVDFGVVVDRGIIVEVGYIRHKPKIANAWVAIARLRVIRRLTRGTAIKIAVVRCRKEDVGGFQIAMHYPLGMKVVDSRHDA